MSKQVCLNEPDKLTPVLRRSKRLKAKYDSSTTEMTEESKAKKIKKTINPPDNQLMDFINTLDHECLVKIFKYVPIPERLELEKVCTRWEIIVREYAWNDIKKINFFDLKKHNYFENQAEAHEILLRCCRYLKELAVPKIMPNSKIVSIIKDNCYNLTKLRINLGANFSEKDFKKICTAIKDLQSINIDLTDWADLRDVLRKNRHILDNIPDNIGELILSSQYSSPLCFSLPFDKFSSLRCLVLRWCKLNSRAAERISQLKTLVDLKLETCSFKGPQRFVLKLPNLERLTLTCLTDFACSDEDFADNCKKLKYVDVCECKMSFGSLGNAENLEFLKLSRTYFNDSAMSAIANNCKNLKHLELAKQNGGWTTSSLGELKKLSSLEHLDLLLYCFPIDYNLISIISNNCLELKYLNLRCKFKSSSREETHNRLNELGNLKNLEYLILPYLDKMDEDTICYIMQECENLKRFELSDFSRVISKSGITKLPILRNLEYLDFKGSSILDDELILCITKKYKGLKTLNLSDCKKVSDPDIKMILENCPRLEKLNLNGTHIKLNTLIIATSLTKFRKNKVILTITAGKLLTEVYKTYGISSLYLHVDWH